MFNIDKIRDDFPILKRKIYNKPLVYLDNAATTQKPKQVIDSISEFYSNKNSNIHRGVHYLSEEADSEYEKARKTVKEYINAEKSSEIIFTQGTTDSLNFIADTFGKSLLKQGDEIIITEMEHHSNIIPWQILCDQKDAVLKTIPVDDNGTLFLEKLKELITDKTRLISLTYVSNVLGTINPVKKIIKQAHKHNIPVIIDGAQAVQHIPTDVQSLDCDFFVFSGHKMYAGTGIGILYAKQKWLEAMPPHRYGGGMISEVSFEKTSFLDPPHKFEAGTVNIAGAVSLKAAVEYINKIGFETISSHEKKVYGYAAEKIRKLPGVTVYGNIADVCGALSFNLDSIHHYDAGALLDKMGIAVRTGKHCAEPLMNRYGIQGTIRASFAIYNSIEDADALLNGIKKVQKILDAK